MEIIVHKSVSDLHKSLHLPATEKLDFTIHFLPDIHPELPFQSPVFRADYFTFILVQSGKGSYTIDSHRFPFKTKSMYFTNPGHIRAFEVEETKVGYMIAFTENFLRENVHRDIFEEFPFLLTEIVPPKVLTDEEFNEFEKAHLQIMEEFRKTSRYKNKILGNLLVTLLLKTKEKFWSDYDPIEDGERNSQIIKSFKQLLEEEFTGLMKGSVKHISNVQEYANRLNLHPNYLSQVMKAKTGKTTNQWISDRTLSAAKTLLKNTTLSSKEIAYMLGFKEPTHFGRFFKKQTGVTPHSFKKSAD